MPDTSRSFHYWQPAPRWRLFPWLGNPGNPAMRPMQQLGTGICHTAKKQREREKGGGKMLRMHAFTTTNPKC